MKQLEKIKLKGIAEILSENELKHILGGYSVSSFCAKGEYLFSCSATIFWGGGISTNISDAGVACAGTGNSAAMDVQSTMSSQLNARKSFYDYYVSVSAYCW